MPFYYGKCSAAICVVLGSKKSTYVSEYASGFFEPQPRIYQQLLRLATKDYSDRLLARIIHERLLRLRMPDSGETGETGETSETGAT